MLSTRPAAPEWSYALELGLGGGGRAVKDSWGGGDTRGVPGSTKGTGHMALGGSAKRSPGRGCSREASRGLRWVPQPAPRTCSWDRRQGTYASESRGFTLPSASLPGWPGVAWPQGTRSEHMNESSS